MEVSGIKSGFIGVLTEASHNDMHCCIFIRIPKNKKEVIYLGFQKTCGRKQIWWFSLHVLLEVKVGIGKNNPEKGNNPKASSNMNITELLRKTAHIVRNNMLFFGNILLKSSLTNNFPLFCGLSPWIPSHEVAQRLTQIRTIYDDESLFLFILHWYLNECVVSHRTFANTMLSAHFNRCP